MKSYKLDDLARMIDHTNLHTDASPKDMEVLCNEAKEHHFAMVAINQVQSGLCAKLLEGTDIHTGAAISFPLGQTTIASKVFDTKDAIANGANEIDYVVNQTEVKASNWIISRMRCHRSLLPAMKKMLLVKSFLKTVILMMRRRSSFVKSPKR